MLIFIMGDITLLNINQIHLEEFVVNTHLYIIFLNRNIALIKQL